MEWEVVLSNNQKITISAPRMIVEGGALIFVDQNNNPLKGFGSGIWLSFTIANKQLQPAAPRVDRISKIMLLLKTAPYRGLEELATRLNMDENILEQELLDAVVTGKVDQTAFILPRLQKSLDDVLPILIKRHGKDKKILVEILQGKTETREADMIQLHIWFNRKRFE